jgi:glycogen(starch) synthase
MRILMLSWEYPPRIIGGISRVVHDLAQRLGAQGNEVHIVTCLDQGAPEEEKDEYVRVHRVRCYDLSTMNFVDWVLQLNFAILEKCIRLVGSTERFDIIHAHDWIVAFAARVLKASYGIPLVSTIHATEWGRNWGIHNEVQRYISSVEWWLTYESWRVIVNSGYMYNEVCQVFHLPQDKIRVIPNGVDLDKFKGYGRDYGFRRNFAADREKIVFFVGRLVNEKGAHILLDAMPKILAYYNDVKLVVTGKGPQLDYLRNKAAIMGIGDKVYFTGYISDDNLSRLYMCVDVAVFPSLYEPFGIVALEGMVAGVPVVVSDVGGIGEIVEHGIDGMKAYAGNPGSLADSILEILHNPGRAEDMKARAFDKLRRLYDWRLISEQALKTYEEVVNDGRNIGRDV